MVSDDRHRSHPIDVPTRFNSLQPATNLHFSSMSQKAIIINDHLSVAWSGKMAVAQYLIQKVANELKEPYTGQGILDVIYNSGISKEELESVSFLFFGFTNTKRDERLFVQNYLTGHTILNDGAKVFYAGSGTFHFLDSIGFNLKGASGNINAFEASVTSFVTRIAIALYEEITSEITHNFYYGGGFELIVFNPEARRFEKTPLTFTFWSHDGDQLELIGPIIALNYSDECLYTHRIAKDEDHLWNLKSYQVGNLLRQNTISDNTRPKPELNTFFVVHYIIYKEDPENVRIMVKKGVEKNIEMKYTRQSGIVEISVSEDFWKELEK